MSCASGSATDLEPLWKEPLRAFKLGFDRQQDPLEFLGKVAERDRDLGVLNILSAGYRQTRRHQLQCLCPIELPPREPLLTPHAVVLLSLPPFDETAALSLPDLLLPQESEILDGGLPCPHCNVKSAFHQVSSWHLGSVALLQLVRETGPGLPLSRTAVFAPIEFEHAKYVFRLRAAVLHRGEAFDSGHYIAFVLTPDDVWVQYNDGAVPKRLPKEPQHLQTHGRYFLYERIHAAPSPMSSPRSAPSSPRSEDADQAGGSNSSAEVGLK